MPLTYEELLQSDEWQAKRLQILERDEYTCQRCGVNKENSYPTKGDEVRENEIGNLFSNIQIYNHPFFNTRLISLDINGQRINVKTTLLELDSSSENELIFIYSFINLSKRNYRRSISSDILIHSNSNNFLIDNMNEELDNKEYPNLTVDPEGIWLVPVTQKEEYNKDNRFLHVHHKCYKRNVNVWAQPDLDYVSLCNVCHRIVHEGENIPVINNLGEIDEKLKPCDRCSGTRIIECYRHVDNGICYKCNGKGLIEIT